MQQIKNVNQNKNMQNAQKNNELPIIIRIKKEKICIKCEIVV